MTVLTVTHSLLSSTICILQQTLRSSQRELKMYAEHIAPIRETGRDHPENLIIDRKIKLKRLLYIILCHYT